MKFSGNSGHSSLLKTVSNLHLQKWTPCNLRGYKALQTWPYIVDFTYPDKYSQQNSCMKITAQLAGQNQRPCNVFHLHWWKWLMNKQDKATFYATQCFRRAEAHLTNDSSRILHKCSVADWTTQTASCFLFCFPTHRHVPAQLQYDGGRPDPELMFSLGTTHSIPSWASPPAHRPCSSCSHQVPSRLWACSTSLWQLLYCGHSQETA